MPVQDFECQIARNQIGRYLNGDGLSSEALRQLGSHVAECIGCKGFLDQRKAALQGMLGEAELPVRVEPAPEPEESMTPSESLIAQLKARSAFEEAQHKAAEKRAAREATARVAAEQGVTADDFVVETGQTRQPYPGRRLITKPILYGAALVVVLISMSYLSKNSSAILGPKVETATPATPIAQPTIAKTNSKATDGLSHPTPLAAKNSTTTDPSSSSKLIAADKSITSDSMSTPVDDSEVEKNLDHDQATGTDGAVAIATAPKAATKLVKKPVAPSTASTALKHSTKPVIKPLTKSATKARLKPTVKKTAKRRVKRVTKRAVRKPRRAFRHARARRATRQKRHFHGPKSGTGTIHIYSDAP